MADAASLLIVALSGRALAQAARRAGRPACVLDLFGDADMRAAAASSSIVTGDLARGFDAEDLLDAAARLAPAQRPRRCGLVYGAGLEDRPALLARLCLGRKLHGNTAQTLARAKDPHDFFPLLQRLRIPHPEVAFAAPRDPGGWLVKTIGASGGAHVMRAERATAGVVNRYFQRSVAGVPVGVSFLADGERARVLGYTTQWTGASVAAPFRFGGIVQPAVLDPAVARALAAAVEALVPALGLVGLNSLDALVDGTAFHVIEVNPRPGAHLDLYDGVGSGKLFEQHLDACAGTLPRDWTPPRRATGMACVYADAETRAPAPASWPDWVADRPSADSVIPPGAPACSVLATAATAAEARALVESRVAAVRSALNNPAAVARQGPPYFEPRSGAAR